MLMKEWKLQILYKVKKDHKESLMLGNFMVFLIYIWKINKFLYMF